MDAGMAAADTLEKQITKRISEVYGDALKTAIKQNKQFFKKLQDIDSGKIKPPAFYDTPEKIAKWREGYIRELMRTEHVTESITQQIKDAGAAVSPEIEKELAGVYAANANYTAQKLTRMKANAPSTGLISSVTRKQAAIIIKDKQPLFSKIAFNNLQNAPAVVKRLQNEMLQASLLGESQQQIIKRIQGVMNNSAKNAKRIAQTERTRLQSQARNDKLKEAEAAGVTVMKEWSCAMMATSRESHIALDGKRVKMGEKFRTIWGNDLEFPGDPNAPAKEVINCHCVMVPDVATEEERKSLQSNGGNGIIKSNKQFGKKVGKHAADYGLDPSKEEDREQMRTIIDNICEMPDEVAYGEWRGLSSKVKFLIKGEDVVVATEAGTFVTILKGGTSNARVKNARGKQI